MRCSLCNKDCPDGEIRLEVKYNRVQFTPCRECGDMIHRTVLMKEIEDEETPTVPLWEIE
jgi:Pyruvate/2-oxoacid:ferredoxin oxidoreductase delta subunit